MHQLQIASYRQDYYPFADNNGSMGANKSMAMVLMNNHSVCS